MTFKNNVKQRMYNRYVCT